MFDCLLVTLKTLSILISWAGLPPVRFFNTKLLHISMVWRRSLAIVDSISGILTRCSPVEMIGIATRTIVAGVADMHLPT